MPPVNPLRSVTSTIPTSTPRTICQNLGRQLVSTRSFTTTSSLQTKTIKPARLPKHLIPPYPHGDRRIYKQSNKGLYGTARIRFGNNVSEKHNVKTPRFWRPNIHVRVYYSDSLGAKVKTRLTMRILKTIKHEGGLENYLLKSTPGRIKELGPAGWNLRWLLMQTRAVQERFNEERVALGMEPKEIEDRDDIVRYALDHATPGKLSARSRETLAEMRMAEVFGLGDEPLGEVEGLEEITDEMEEEFLRQMEEQEAGVEAETKVKTEKESVAA